MALRRLRMQLNTFFSGPQAWFFLAQQRGYLADEGLEVDFIEGDTAANTIPKMAAHGLDVGYGDLNALIAHAGAGLANLPIAVFASFNASPYTIAVPAKPSQGIAITKPAELAGTHLVAHPQDAALLLFPELCAATGLALASIQISTNPAPHSQLLTQMLAGQWQGIFGFVNTLIAAALEAGMAQPHAQLRFLQYHDHIPQLYGMALMASPALVQHGPQLITGLLRAFNRGLADTVADPQAAIDALAIQNPSINRNSNLRRLIGTLELEMGRAEGARLGIGDLDDARFQSGIELICKTKGLAYTPRASELFSRAFLPPLEERIRHLARGA